MMKNKAEGKWTKVVLVGSLALLALGIAAFVLYQTGTLSKWFGWDLDRVLTVQETTVSLDADAYVTTKVSKDLLLRSNCSGLRASKASGVTAWDIAFQMTAPNLQVNGEYAAVADCEGTLAIVADQKGERYRVSVDKKIQMMALNAKGEMTLVLEDQAENWIQVYNNEGTLLIERHTYQNKDGLVLAVALSDDTSRLVTSYYKFTGSACGSLLTAFDLSSKGVSLVDRILGSTTVEGEMVVDLFFAGTRCFFVSESSFGVLLTEKEMSVSWREETGRKLEAVAFAGKTIALVFSEGRIGLKTNGDPGISVYNSDGTRVFFEKNESLSVLNAGNSSYIYGNGNAFTAISERGVRLWQADLSVYNEAMHAFADDKTVVGQTKGLLQYYSVENK